MRLNELKTDKVVRDHTGKPLRGLARDIALRAKANRIKGPAPKIKDQMVGNARIVPYETQKAEDLWSENNVLK